MIDRTTTAMTADPAARTNVFRSDVRKIESPSTVCQCSSVHGDGPKKPYTFMKVPIARKTSGTTVTRSAHKDTTPKAGQRQAPSSVGWPLYLPLTVAYRPRVVTHHWRRIKGSMTTRIRTAMAVAVPNNGGSW